MDKYEYNLKLDQLKSMVAASDYAAAADLADTINWKKVRNSKTLMMVAEVYEQCKNYEACKDVLLQAYDHSSIGRNIVRRLAEVAILSKNVAEAEDYYHEFLEISPRDNQRYIIAYKISCLKNAPLSDRISILEAYKEQEYNELWAFELAALYSQANMRDKCVDTCDELVLWFGDGEYVEKALDLKRSFQPLTPSQEEKYQSFRSKNDMVEINIPAQTADLSAASDALPERTVTASRFNTVNLQDELAKSMQQILEAKEKETVRDTMENIKRIVADVPYLSGEETQEDRLDEYEKINEEVDETLRADFQDYLMEEPAEPAVPEEDAETEDVPVSPMSIEEVLAEWEKTKHAAEVAIAAAEQKKLDMEKEKALAEANDIMNRLKTLFPVLSAEPGEDIPMAPETVGAALEPASVEPVMAREEAEEPKEVTTEPESIIIADNQETKEEPMAPVLLAEEEPQSIANEAPADDLDDFDIPEIEAVAEKTIEEMMAALVAEEMMAATQEVIAEEAKPEEAIAEQQPEDNRSDVTDSEEAAVAEPPMEVVEETDQEEQKEVADDADDVDQLALELERILAAELAAEAQQEEEDKPDEPTEDLPEEESFVLPEIALPEDILAEEPKEEPAAEKNPAVGMFTEEEMKELFTYFLPIPGLREQITQVLQEAKLYKGNAITSLRGNLIVQGEEGCGKTVLATSLIKAIQRLVGNEDAKIGKIQASALNRKDFASIVPRIAGGYLIVDNAGDLTQETVVRMSQVMEQNTQGMVVVLEDDGAGIKKALSLDLGFAHKFTGKIKIPVFTIDELVEFGKSYAKEMECVIDEMGVLAMYNRINNIQKLDHATTLTEVKDIVDQAIESAESGGIRKFFAKKYDENDYLILHENDFE